jgi:hypothetical protein
VVQDTVQWRAHRYWNKKNPLGVGVFKQGCLFYAGIRNHLQGQTLMMFHHHHHHHHHANNFLQFSVTFMKIIYKVRHVYSMDN